MAYTKHFSELAKKDVSIAGGKGASLGEMFNNGISVPPGFVVLSAAFDRFIKDNGIDVEIDAALDVINPKEMHTIEDASEKIQALILNEDMPENICEEIKKAFTGLDAKFVAVRSSATSEDSAMAAWAGQLESYLNTAEKDLLKNVKRCWASLFTPRAIFYKFEKGIPKQKVSVAVVVQKMVESEASGVGFSVHPVTQDENQLIIEAGFGLGEAIVSGQITPDSYVVDKRDLKILEKCINIKTRSLHRNSTGKNEWKDLPEEHGKKQVLSGKEIIELSKMIIKIEKHYGFPVDIEWGIENRKLYILQSRPITTLGK